MIERASYTDHIRKYIGTPVVKVITGLRRSGKSSILRLLMQGLRKDGVGEECLLYYNFESFQHEHLSTARALYNELSSRLAVCKEQSYLFLDEIQEVADWEKAINSLRVDFQTEIFITGSNSRLLSSELSTYLAGRYVEFPIYTLSYEESRVFREEWSASPLPPPKEDFMHYLQLGGFPILYNADYTYETAHKLVYDIYSSTVLRDTVQRFNIRNIELLERVIRYVFDNIGNSFSAKKVADYFKSQQRRIDLNTVYNYLSALESAFIVYRIPRYDIQGKEILKTQEKFFLGDPSFLYAVAGFKDQKIGGLLENIVALELMRRGYQVFIGKLKDWEIDFIATKQSEKLYFQVTYLLSSEEAVEREFRPLLKIQDQYPKYVLSLDPTWQQTFDGVKHLHLADWLLPIGDG